MATWVSVTNDLGQRSGAWLFLLSRWVGASLRLYLVAIVLQQLVFWTPGVAICTHRMPHPFPDMAVHQAWRYPDCRHH